MWLLAPRHRRGECPDLDSNQGLDFRRVLCRSATPSGRSRGGWPRQSTSEWIRTRSAVLEATRFQELARVGSGTVGSERRNHFHDSAAGRADESSARFRTGRPPQPDASSSSISIHSAALADLLLQLDRPVGLAENFDQLSIRTSWRA